MKRMIRLIFLTILLLPACGANKAQDPGQCLKTSRQAGELVHLVSDQYPDRFNALHHVGVNIRGETVVLNGFLTVDRAAGDVRLVAQGEMGGTLFEVHLMDGRVDKVTSNGVLKKKWLEASVVQDLTYLYVKPVFQAPQVCLRDGETLLSDTHDNRTLAYVFHRQGPAGFHLSEFRVLHRGTPEYKIEYSYGQKDGLPDFITIENKKLGYTLDINVRYMVPKTQ